MGVMAFTYSHGLTEMTTHWPYYEQGTKRKYYQHHDKAGAMEAAEDFLVFCCKRHDVLGSAITDTGDSVDLLVVWKD